MEGARRFTDLVAWQKARELTKRIYEVTRHGEFTKDFGLSGQMQRAAVSVMSNIAEGYERRRPTEFARYILIAKASCVELQSQIYVALDIGYIDELQFRDLVAMTDEVARVTAGLGTYLAKCK